MCGIFAVYNDQSNQAAQTVLKALKKLEYRGYDSWGIALKAKDGLYLDKHIGKIGQAKTKLNKGKMAIGHTRWATHGEVTNNNAHPHLDCTGKIALIHNGIVENYQELRLKLKNLGHKFSSETDTEVIAHMIEELLKTKTIRQAVFSVFRRLKGSNAIVVLENNSKTIIACRDGSSLVVGIGDDEYFLTSDVTAFLDKTQKAVFLQDRQGVVLNKKGVGVYNIDKNKKAKLKIEIIDWEYEDVQKGGYPHFLLKEIMEQAITIPKTASLNEKEINLIAKKIRKSKKVIIFACGTASYCALAAEYYFAQAGIETRSYGAYEFAPFIRFCDKDTVAIAISQSGETADTLLAAKAVKKQGACLVAVVNAPASSLERMANTVLRVGAGPEIAVVSTKAFTSQLATLYLLSRAIQGEYKQGQKDIKKLGKKLDKWINQKLHNQVLDLAKKLMDKEHAYLIGKHLQYPGVLEFALKIKETSYLHSEAFASGELKHGVISLITNDTPCIVLAEQNRLKNEVLSSAMEVKARGGKIVGVAPYNASEFDEHIKTPEVKELTIFPNVIVGQLLAYYLGLARGTDPDKPRNLAKSVTVK